jgi:glutathionyl-hydroquinone reductase
MRAHTGCNLYKITERYHHLNRWFMRLYKQDAFRKATNVDMARQRSLLAARCSPISQFKAGYADSQKAPSTIVPIGPANVYFDT